MKRAVLGLTVLYLSLFGGITMGAERPYFVRGYIDIYGFINNPETKLARADWCTPTLEGNFSDKKLMATDLMWEIFKDLINKDSAAGFDHCPYLPGTKSEQVPYLLHLKMSYSHAVGRGDDYLEAVLLVNMPVLEGVQVVEVSRRQINQRYWRDDLRMSRKLAKLFVKDLEKKFDLNAAQK